MDPFGSSCCPNSDWIWVHFMVSQAAQRSPCFCAASIIRKHGCLVVFRLAGQADPRPAARTPRAAALPRSPPRCPVRLSPCGALLKSGMLCPWNGPARADCATGALMCAGILSRRPNLGLRQQIMFCLSVPGDLWLFRQLDFSVFSFTFGLS